MQDNFEPIICNCNHKENCKNCDSEKCKSCIHIRKYPDTLSFLDYSHGHYYSVPYYSVPSHRHYYSFPWQLP
jgi:hypothetical protein